MYSLTFFKNTKGPFSKKSSRYLQSPNLFFSIFYGPQTMQEERKNLKREAEELEERKRQYVKSIERSALQTAQTKVFLNDTYVRWLQFFFQSRIKSLTVCSQSSFNKTSNNKLQGGCYGEVDFFILSFVAIKDWEEVIYTLKGRFKYHYSCPRSWVKLFQNETELLNLETGYSFDEYVKEDQDEQKIFANERKLFEDVLNITEGCQIDLFYATLHGFLRSYLMELQKLEADDNDSDVLRVESLGLMFKYI